MHIWDFSFFCNSKPNSPDEHRHPHVLAVHVDVSPRVLDDLPLGIRQRLRALRTVFAVPPAHPQQLWRRRGQRRRLPARHPPAAQQPGGSQQRPGEVRGQGGGERDGELRPHGGSWGGGSQGEKRMRRRRREGARQH